MPLLLSLISVVFSYLSPAELFPSLAPYHMQQVILFPAVAATLASMAMRAAGLRLPQDVLMIGLWFAVCMSSLSRFMLRDTWYGFLAFALPVCIYFLVAANGFTVERIRLISAVLSLTAIVIAVQGMLAYHTGLDAHNLIHESMVEDFRLIRRIRGYGILNDPNDLAQFLLVGLALLGQFWNKENRLGSIGLLAIPGGILLYGIFLTGSRGAIFGLAMIVVVVASARLGGLQSMVVGVVLLLIMVAAQFGGGRAMSMREGSAAGRITAWGAGIVMLKARPLFGIGFGQFGERYSDMTAHNSFVLCFAELGFFGYFFWLALILTTVWGLQRLVKISGDAPADRKGQRSVSAIRAALFGFVATAWFLSRTYSPTLFTLLALATALIHLRQKENPKLALVPQRWIPVTIACQFASVILIYATIRVRGL